MAIKCRSGIIYINRLHPNGKNTFYQDDDGDVLYRR